jgi:hypothetical protein
MVFIMDAGSSLEAFIRAALAVQASAEGLRAGVALSASAFF